jgi:membrane protein implicated in regulation of membrane protease activity
MYLVAIAWMYVVLMMALAEALASNGTLLGALFTLLLYGLLPLSILLYIMGTPLRRRRARRLDAASARDENEGPETPADAVAAVRKEI